MNQKDDIEKTCEKIVYNFNIINEHNNEWDNLQSQVKQLLMLVIH